ncbi:MAG: spore photoproduct lyase family protein [Pseudomonadota bacterium]
MIIYVEQAIIDHPRVKGIVQRHSNSEVVEIAHYGEVFNPSKQHFRTQKQNPSLILAEKQHQLVHETPSVYETGGGANYYFSHMLNCLYDCRYCFLQGMFNSANYLLFVNYEAFVTDIKRIAQQHADDQKPVWFFSGYDCDSLAYEPVSGFAEHFVPAFADIPNSVLELRTKSTQVRSLLKRPAQSNVVVAMSLSPQNIVKTIEIGTPTLEKRLKALSELQTNGWRIGIRFDPVIWHEEYQENYRDLVREVFARLDPGLIDSVTLGGFRVPKTYFKSMLKQFPREPMFNLGLDEQDGLITYRADIEHTVLDFVSDLIRPHIDERKLFVYKSDSDASESQVMAING